MQRDPNQWGGFSFDPYSNGNTPPIPSYNDPMASMRPHEFPAPLNQVEFQPSDTCPKNIVIFDQTYHKSRVMFHPSLAQKFGSSSYYEANAYGNAYGNGKGISRETYKEDTEEIDALLTSSEEGEEDDEVSTGRTPGYWENNDSSPDCSSSSSMPVNSGGKDKKKDRMKKMVRTLKGMIPGGEQMDTPAVLDEAVRYLKSLKVEVKKLGSRNSDK